MTAILWAFAATGFFGLRPHMETLAYPSLESCERDRPRIEMDMLARGYSGIATVCRGNDGY